MNNRKIILKYIGLFFLLLLSTDLYGIDSFEVDGFRYYKLTYNQVEITYKSNEGGDYSGTLVIPSKVTYNGFTYNVTSIGYKAFYNCSGLTGSLSIPNSITNIGQAAFENCNNLTSITIGNSVTDIRVRAFSGCSSLTSITIPNCVTSISGNVFSGCSSLTSIEVESGNTKYDSRDNCNAIIETESNKLIVGCATTIIPNGVTSIGDSAFSGCFGLTAVIIPNSVTWISDIAFYNCSGLTSIVVESGNTKYDSRDNCNAIIETESNTLFLGCITTIIPNSVTSIGDTAFSNCTGLTSIMIPNSVTSIGTSAFFQCNALTSVISSIQNPFQINESVFYGIPSNATLQVPKGTKSKYEAFSGWTTNFKEIVEENSSSQTDKETFLPITISPESGAVVTQLPKKISLGFESNVKLSSSIVKFTNGVSSFTATIKVNPNNSNETIIEHDYNVTEASTWSVEIPAGLIHNEYYGIDDSADRWNPAMSFTYTVDGSLVSPTTYSLTVSASGNGSASFNGTTIRSKTSSFTVNEGASATITFSPDNGNSIASVKLNNSDVTSQVSGNRYTINNITDNMTLTVTFQEDVNALTVDGVNYTVVSQADRTVKVTGGDFGQVLTVPATVTQNGKTWTVTGIDTNALKNNTELAAVIWNPTYNFTATVSNPNLLLYVKAEQYAPSSIQNVVVNGTATNIVLAEAQSGNNFYCPQAFVAQKISYTHNYQMQTGLGESKGWETIALPFDVQTITHETKGTIVPFAQWNNESNKKPFWLMELTGTGFVETGSIKAYTPYIISMPNNPQYDSQWILKGKVTFAASSVTIGKTDNLNQPVFNGRTFIPCFAEKKADEGFYALNVSNDWETNNSGMTEGSKFVLNMRMIHPFEAYMTSSSNAAPYFDVFDDMTTGIQVMDEGRWMKEETVYDLQGRKVENPSKKGVYIVNGKKMIIK